MERVKHKKVLPQEGTNVYGVGESVPGPSGSGCSTYSGGSNVSHYPSTMNSRVQANTMPSAQHITNTSWRLTPRSTHVRQNSNAFSASTATLGVKKRPGKRNRRARRSKNPEYPGGSEPNMSVNAPLDERQYSSPVEMTRSNYFAPSTNYNIKNVEDSDESECMGPIRSMYCEPDMTAYAPSVDSRQRGHNPSQPTESPNMSQGKSFRSYDMSPSRTNVYVDDADDARMTRRGSSPPEKRFRADDSLAPRSDLRMEEAGSSRWYQTNYPVRCEGVAKPTYSTLPSETIRGPPNARTSQEQSVLPKKAKRKRKSKTDTIPRRPPAEVVGSASSHLLVAIAAVPPTNFTTDQASQLEAAIEEKIIEAALATSLNNEAKLAPSFRGKPISSEGVLKMWCENDNSLNWLKHTVASLQSPIPGTKLTVIRQSDITRKTRASLWLPKSAGLDLNAIHRLLTAQNPWYDVQLWSLYSAAMQEKGIYLNLGIPESQVAKIQERGRRVAFITGSVYVKFSSADGKGDSETTVTRDTNRATKLGHASSSTFPNADPVSSLAMDSDLSVYSDASDYCASSDEYYTSSDEPYMNNNSL